MTEADVCNMALGYIGKQAIVTLDEHNSNAITCKLYYDVCRRKILRSFEWNFARKQEQLAVIDSDRKGWKYVYNYPEDCLLAYRIFNQNVANADFNIVSVNENVKGIAAQTPNAWIDYLCDIKDLSIFPEDLIIAFARLLASNVAVSLAGSSSTSAEQYAQYKEALKEAQRNAALEQARKLQQKGFTYARSRL